MAMKTLKRIQMLVVTEEGEYSHIPQTIYIDTNEPVQFVIRVPSYVVNALGCKDEVRGGQAMNVKPQFEKVMRQYLEWVKAAKAEPVIVLHTKLLSTDRSGAPGRRHDIDKDAFFHRNRDREAEHHAVVDVSYSLMFRVNGHIHWRKKDRETGEFKVGDRASYVDGIELDYTPELHARLDRICNALHDAAHTLNEIIESKDVGAALLASANLRLSMPEGQ